MPQRKYTSELRQAQAQATADRILQAVVEVLADGVDTLSIPAVAQRAGVSVGTVYKHFGNKAGLMKALTTYAGRQSGLADTTIPRTPEELANVIEMVFRHFEDTDDLMKAAFASAIGHEIRIKGSPERLAAMEEAMRSIANDLSSDQIERAARVALVLTTSDAYRQFKERLGHTPEEAARDVTLAIEAMLRGFAG